MKMTVCLKTLPLLEEAKSFSPFSNARLISDHTMVKVLKSSNSTLVKCKIGCVIVLLATNNKQPDILNFL